MLIIKVMPMQKMILITISQKGNNYITVDANLSYAFENGIELYTGVSNLFDKKYADAVTSTRSSWGAGPRKVYYPANGRSVYAGIKYTF